MTELQVCAPCPPELLPEGLTEKCRATCDVHDCDLRADHGGVRHAVLSVSGHVIAVFEQTPLSVWQMAVFRELTDVDEAISAAIGMAYRVAGQAVIEARLAGDVVMAEVVRDFRSRLGSYEARFGEDDPERGWPDIFDEAAARLAAARMEQRKSEVS